MWIKKRTVAAKLASSRPPGPTSSLQALQRMIGNRAVARVLAGRAVSAPVVQRDDKADLRAFVGHVRLLTRASVLNDLPETELKAAVARMSLAEVKNMLDVVPLTSMHRIRGTLLSRMYDDCVQHARWKDAVSYLNGFDDPGIVERIERLKDSVDSRRELIVAALENARVLALIRTATGLAIDEKKPFGELRTAGFVPQQDGRYTDADAGTITIEFVPNPDLVSAEEIAFVQTIRRVYTGTDSTAKYSFGMGDRATDRGTTVDRLGKRKFGWFGHEDSGKAGTKVEVGFCRSNSDKKPSAMTDTPGKVRGTENTFEACAIAKAGKDTGRVYGCLVWGFTVDDNFGVRPKPVEVQLKTSSEFQAATVNWNAQAAGTIGGGSSDQQSLPSKK